MSVSTCGFVICHQSYNIEILAAVNEAINSYVDEKISNFKKTIGEIRFVPSLHHFQHPQIATMVSKLQESKVWTSHSLNFSGGEANAHRTLWVHVGASDHRDIAGDKHVFSFSIGHWGESFEIMNRVLDSVKHFGQTYFQESDSGENECDFVEIHKSFPRLVSADLNNLINQYK